MGIALPFLTDATHGSHHPRTPSVSRIHLTNFISKTPNHAMLIPRVISQSPRRLHVVFQTPRPWPHCTPQRYASSSKAADAAQSEGQGLPAPGEGVTLDMSNGDTSAKLSQLGPL